MKPTDKELVESACQGDTESFRILYERYWRLAISIAASRLRDRHLAEDVAQESFAVACQKLSTLKNGMRFPQWLGTIVRRTASAAVASNHSSLDSIADPVTLVDHQSDYEDLRAAIDQLPDSQREAIFLRYFGDLSYQQIADATKTSTASVHGLLQRARLSLSKELDRLSNR